MPGVVEGTFAQPDRRRHGRPLVRPAQSSSIRGFPLRHHIPAGGAITMEDIYHYIPIVAKLGRTNKAADADLKFAIENSIGGTCPPPDPSLWVGAGCSASDGTTMTWTAAIAVHGAPHPSRHADVSKTPMRPWSTDPRQHIKVKIGVPIDDLEIFEKPSTSATFQKCLAIGWQRHAPRWRHSDRHVLVAA